MKDVTISEKEYLNLLNYKRIVQLIEFELHEPEFKEEFIKEVESIRKEGKFSKTGSVNDLFKEIEENV
ncbi:MAG: hypothetical protein PHU63_03500 [Candidatus ainarchaeum sp.]|nr:hypothetical protein [Candidatus ainarchaeum sp.]